MGVDAAIDITTEERQTVLALLQRHLPGTAAWVYGSRVKWTSRPQSDLDLDLVVFATPEQRPQVGDLREAFEESNLPFRVDLFVWDEVPDSFRARIEAEHVALAATGERQDDERWKEVPLGNLVDIYDGPHATPKKTPRGPVFLGISNLASGRLDITQTQHLSEPDYLSWTRRVTPKPNDIVFSYETRLGEAALIPEGLRACLGRRMGLLRVRDGVIDARFLLYAFLGERFQTTLRSRTVHGSTVDRIPLTEIADFPIYVPQALTEQLAIAHVLGTLDDKIELNRRMNATLEALARALFRSWFVDFDPVRAKMEGRDTGLPKDIADLFPDRLVDSELGEIPEGWKVAKLGDLLEFAYGKALRAEDRQHDGRVPVYGSRGQVGWHDRKLVQGPGIVVGRKGNPGVVTWVAVDFFPIDTTFYVVPKNGTGALYFLFYALEDQDLSSVAADSAVPGLNRNMAYMNRQILPAEGVVEQFSTYVGPIFARCDSLNEESMALVSLRDVLLPKLVSGELPVSHLKAANGHEQAAGTGSGSSAGKLKECPA